MGLLFVGNNIININECGDWCFVEFSGFNKSESIRYSKFEVILKLYEVLPTVEEVVKVRKIKYNKYIDLALKYKFDNYRICTLNDLSKLGLMKSFTENQRNFFNESGEFVAIFNTIGGKPVSLVFRSIEGKKFVDFSMFYTLYGLDLIDSSFKYGDWLVLTEGIYDADSFRSIYRNVVALLTSNVTIMQSEVLNTITDKFIIAFDNDEGGRFGVNKSLKRLKESNDSCVVEVMNLFSRDKDLGEMEEKSGDLEGYELRRGYYKSFIVGTLGSYGNGSKGDEVKWVNC